MVLFPRSGFGRFLLFLIILSTLSYLVLNIVSFGGTNWISYVDVPIRFGLWRVCDTSITNGCNQWADSSFASVNVYNTFNGVKPSFVRSSQALEIISLVFYIVAGFLIVLGIINIGELSYEIFFLDGAFLLSICIVFLSASLALMSVQGRANHPSSYLDWAWWNGLVGLIMTIVCFFSLIFLILDLRFSPNSPYSRSSSKPISTTQRDFNQNYLWNDYPSYPVIMNEISPPMMMMPPPLINPSYDYPYSDNYIEDPMLTYGAGYPPVEEYVNNFDPMMMYGVEYPPVEEHLNNFDPMMMYGGSYNDGQNSVDQNPSPLMSALVRNYIYQMADAQYENEIVENYFQSMNSEYIQNNYF